MLVVISVLEESFCSLCPLPFSPATSHPSQFIDLQVQCPLCHCVRRLLLTQRDQSEFTAAGIPPGGEGSESEHSAVTGRAWRTWQKRPLTTAESPFEFAAMSSEENFTSEGARFSPYVVTHQQPSTAVFPFTQVWPASCVLGKEPESCCLLWGIHILTSPLQSK